MSSSECQSPLTLSLVMLPQSVMVRVHFKLGEQIQAGLDQLGHTTVGLSIMSCVAFVCICNVRVVKF